MNKNKIYEKTEKIGNKFSLTQDVCSHSCIVTITGTMEVLVENYKGLSEYTSERIVLDGIRGKIIVTGKRLTIRNYDNEDCIIQGKIDAVFLDKAAEV